MKKLLSLLAVMAMLMGFTACSDDNNEPLAPTSSTTSIEALNVKTVTAGNVSNESSCATDITVDPSKGTVSLTFKGISFSSRMPAVTFSLEGMKYTTGKNSRTEYHFTASTLTPMPGYTVTNVDGYANPKDGVLYVSYVVNNTWTVNISSQLYYSALSDGKFSYGTTNDTYITYFLYQANSAWKGDIKMFNIQFAPQMPTLKQIRIPLAGVTITPTATGYNMSGTDIVPYYTTGTTEAPMKDRTITDLTGSVDLVTKKYTLQFTCFGQTVSYNGSLYYPANNNEPLAPTSSSTSIETLNVKTVTAGNVSNESSCATDITVDPSKGTVSLTFKGISFSSRMPAVTFSLEGMKYTTGKNSRTEYHFTASTLTPMPGYTVTNVDGYANPKDGVLYVSYVVNNTWTVNISSQLYYSALSDGKFSYGTTNDTYITYFLYQANSAWKGDIKMFNIQFAPQMPTLKQIRIPLAGVTITPTATGYNMSGTDIVPYYTTGTTEAPMKDRTITDLTGSVDLVTKKYTLQFTCFGLTVSYNGSLYYPANN